MEEKDLLTERKKKGKTNRLRFVQRWDHDCFGSVRGYEHFELATHSCGKDKLSIGAKHFTNTQKDDKRPSGIKYTDGK